MKLYVLLMALLVMGIWQAISSKELPVAKRTFMYCAPSFDPDIWKKGDAPLLKGLGSVHYKVNTRSAKAQKFFNQGLALTYGFNHGEAYRSFKTALKHDSTCAMAYWGIAMVLGPNYNAPLNPASLADINDAIDKAVKYSKGASPKEKALIHTMTKRFPREEVKDMTPYYEAYAQALKEAHESFPKDMDIATIYADALMNLHPWNLWLKDGNPQPWTPEIVALIEKILQKIPDHPGAMHYYIHATEASNKAEVALPYADKLRTAMPAAGHMVHMPSHTYIRTGHYHKGVVANEKASLADSVYIAQCRAEGFYPLVLYPHNIHFLAACAFLEGSSQKALDAARMVSRKADRKYLADMAGVQHFYIIPLYVMVHLGRWDEILQEPEPGKSLKYPTAIWHYARGMALAAKGNKTAAEQELKTIQEMLADGSLKDLSIWDVNTIMDLVQIAAYSLEGELAGYNGDYATAEDRLTKAIEIEDKLAYTEPPDWFFSVRLSLGHWLVKGKKYAEAEKVYEKDLETFKENGWALKGLFNSLKGQGKEAEALAVSKRFNEAWKYADMKIESSRKF